MKKKKDKSIIVAGVLLGLIIIGIIIAVLMMGGGETRTSADISGEGREVLICSSSIPKDSFFTTSANVTNLNHELKFIFEKHKLSTATYTYKATFDSETTAKDEVSKMNWNYDDFMERAGLYHDNLTPVFSVYGSDATIGLSFKKEDFTPEISSLLFLTKDEFKGIANYSANQLSKIYKYKNFSCKTKEVNT